MTAAVDGVRRVCFSVMGADEIRRMAACEITLPCGQAVEGGLYDPRMGAVDYGSVCATCKHDNRKCPGHFGYIELAVPLFNSLFTKFVKNILRTVCIHCSAVCLPASFSNDGRVGEAELNRASTESTAKVKGMCPSCGRPRYEKIRYDKKGMTSFVCTLDGSDVSLSSTRVFEILSKITDKDCRRLGMNPRCTRPENLMFKALPVTPIAVRPPHRQRRDDDLTHKLADIIKANDKVRAKVDAGLDPELYKGWVEILQVEIIQLIENSGIGTPQARMRAPNRPLKSIASRLKGKDGRVRNNLMGKRVDFSARSVITPEPNISVDELGVPIRIAMTLTFPEVVHVGNRDRLTRAVQNGPDAYPGARFHVRGGVITSLERETARARVKLALGDTVERHVIDGDNVLFNRQPSLHRMSMMTHRVRVMPSDTFRLNVLVTECFNADFDGDEMNLHLPQSMSTQVEINRLGSVKTQVISPRHHRPIIGIVQDVALGTHLLTCDDVKVDARTAANICARCSVDMPTDDADVSGKDLFSKILPTTLHCLSHGSSIEHGDVKIGPIGKKQYQAETTGILHSIFVEDGQDSAVRLLNCTQWMACDWLVGRGFSMGARDIVVAEETEARLGEIAETARSGVDAILNSVHSGKFVNETAQDDVSHLEALIRDITMKAGDEAAKAAKADGEKSQSRLLDMVQSKSKGNGSNVQQMMGMLGQNYVDFSRIPATSSGRTLPHFRRFDDGANSRGFVGSSFRDGLKPHEFFFHAMAGREGLIDTAVKTAESGYIQRKLVKALEDLKVAPDGSVRSASRKIISFKYGGDGMDACSIESQKIPSFEDGGMETLAARFLLSRNDDAEMDQILSKHAHASWRSLSFSDFRRLASHFSKIVEDKGFIASVHERVGAGDAAPPPGDIYHAVAFERIIDRITLEHNPASFGSDLEPIKVLDVQDALVRELYPETPGSTCIGAAMIRAFLSPKRLIRRGVCERALSRIAATIRRRFYSSVVSTSDMVGILAAQSIAETSTQMVLNSFHQAGTHGEGGSLPRVKDLLNASKNPKQTLYRVKLLPGIDESEQFATIVRDKILCTHMSDIVLRSSMICENGRFHDPDDARIERLSAMFSRKPTEASGSSSDASNKERSEHPSSGGGGGEFTLRLEMDRAKMVEHGVSMLDVHRTVFDCAHGKVVPSDDASRNLVIRVTLPNDRVNGVDIVVELRQLESEVLDKRIKGVKGVDRCIVKRETVSEYDNQRADYSARTRFSVYATGGSGACASDMAEIASVPGVDSTESHSNNLCHVASTLGVEGARSFLLRELQASYSSDTYADFRHIELLVDYMTHRGELTAIARYGIGATDAGPLSKCSFELTVTKLVHAGVFGEVDDVSGVSANIMLGQTTPCGTGDSALLWDPSVADLPDGETLQLKTESKRGRAFPIGAIVAFDPRSTPTGSIPSAEISWKGVPGFKVSKSHRDVEVRT